MPISWEPAAPVALAGGVYADAARSMYEEQSRRRPAQSGAASSAYEGGGGRGVYDDGSLVQQAVLARDRLQFDQQRDALDRTAVNQSDIFRAQSQYSLGQADAQNRAALAEQQYAQTLGLQQDRFRLQTELQNTELSQQEKMRLSRMQNAIGAVNADPTLSDAEKAEMVTQLKTGIDPLQRRLAAERLAAEKQQKEAMAEQYQAVAALRKQEMDVMAKSLPDRSVFLHDSQALAEITEDLIESLPPVVRNIPGLVEKMAKAEAVRQGLGRNVFQHGPTKYELMDPLDGGPGKAAGGRGGKDQTPGNATLLSPTDWTKARTAAERAVDAMRKETVKDPLNVRPPTARYPELQTPDGFDAAVRKRLADQKVPQDLEEYLSLAQSRPGGEAPSGRGGRYDPARASWRKGQPQTPPEPTAQPPAGAAPKPPDRRGDEEFRSIVADPSIPEGDKNHLGNLMRRAFEIAEKYPDPASRPPEITMAQERIRAEYKAAVEAAKTKIKYVNDHGTPPDDGWAPFADVARQAWGIK